MVIAKKIKKTVIACGLWACLAPSGLGAAPPDDSPLIIRHGLQIAQGTRLFYESHAVVHPLRPPVRETYEIEIAEKWTGGVIFNYEITQSVLGTESGIESLSSLDDCRSLDPWWEPSQTSFDGRCELWISPKHLRELIADGKTYLAVDTLVRKDSAVRWTYEGSQAYRLNVGGKMTSVPAVIATTSRGDRFVILKDFGNPLILQAESSYFSWKLLRATR